MRVVTVLARCGTAQYPRAEQEIADIFTRQMAAIDRTVLIVDNALPAGFKEGEGRRFLIGGDNSAREFSAFDCGMRFLGSNIWSYDLIHFATSAFNTLHVNYLERLDAALLAAITSRPVCVGHIDCYNEAVEILGFRSQHWIRTCWFFLAPGEAKMLGSFVTVRDGAAFFTSDPAAPFKADAPLSRNYREYIIRWLTGEDIGQRVRWHSKFELGPATLPAFQQKALTIMNEQLLGIRLRAMGCRLIDVTWLATMLPTTRQSSIDWATKWEAQLAQRDRDAVMVPAGGAQF
jgi:hypothetical protein